MAKDAHFYLLASDGVTVEQVVRVLNFGDDVSPELALGFGGVVRRIERIIPRADRFDVYVGSVAPTKH